ncbi:MAG TPA: hypothetical protein VGE52_20660, partial [Pirellulales bacterium]
FASRIWNVASSASDEIPLVVGLVQPEVLANSPDPSERRCAASVLAAVVGSLEHTTQETFRARHRKAEDVQMWRDGASYSRKSPSRLFCELVLPAVHKAFDDPDPFVRGRAAAIVLLAGARAEGDGLPREGDESLWPRAVQAFDDPSPEVRRCAYVAAASICWRVEPSCLSPEESQSLWARLVEGLDDPEPRIRRTLHLELLKTTTQRYAPYPYLNQFYPIEKLPDGATPLRASRVKELGKPGLWDRLVAGCHDSDPFVRRDVFAALASLPASPDYATKVPPLLLEAAVAQLADPDPRVARPAAAWLAQFPPQPALTDYFAKRLQEPAPPEAAEEEFGEWLAAAEWMLTYSPDATPIGAALDYLTTSESHFRYELAASALRIVLNANRLDDFLARLAAAPPDRERLYATRLNGAAPWSDAQLAALARFTAELGPERVELTKSLLLTLHERGVPAIDEQIAKWANDPATGPTLRFATLELGALARGDALAAPLGSSDPIAGLLALTTLRRAAAAGIAGPDASALPKHAQALLAGVKRR